MTERIKKVLQSLRYVRTVHLVKEIGPYYYGLITDIFGVTDIKVMTRRGQDLIILSNTPDKQVEKELYEQAGISPSN